MGVSWSCPFALHCDLENAFESVVENSIKLVDDDDKNKQVRLSSFKSTDSEPAALQSFERKTQTELLSESSSLMGNIPHSPILNPSSPKHEAAIKLQKVYKSFRTRRKLADCAVLIEQSWWKLLDFAELKRSSISFFDIEKHETAISRWSRARTRAAKVGKGLSKNSKAQKLALQHWLEAIDPRHRYGHNLHFYYMNWLNCQSKEPFFYWLDIGEGKEVNLIEKCPRSKLQQQCIKYLGPMERKAYEVAVEDGKLLYKETGELLDTIDEPKGSKWIFVLSTSRILYVGQKRKGSFQHSSFLAGGATLAAGRIVADNGVLKAVWPHSGHYRPTSENFQDFISFMRENDVDLNEVELDSTDDEEKESVRKHVRSNSSEDDLITKDQLEMEGNNVEDSASKKVVSGEEESVAVSTTEFTELSQSPGLSKLTLQIPCKDDLLDTFKCENESLSIFKQEMEEEEEVITEESVFQRINSHKEMKSYQLGKQLSFKWSTGAGPRIGCLRDYPSGLQTHALEQVNLSPRSKRRLRLDFSSRASTPSGSNLSRTTSCNI
ncbi:hypothetical protein ACS0TY_026815 [Phlomoides rotata]